MLIAFAYSLESLLDHMSSYIQLIWDILLSVSALHRWRVYDMCCHGYSQYGRNLADSLHKIQIIGTFWPIYWLYYTEQVYQYGNNIRMFYWSPIYLGGDFYSSWPSTRASSPTWTIKVSSNLSYSIYNISYYVYAYCQGYSFKIVLLMHSYWVCR